MHDAMKTHFPDASTLVMGRDCQATQARIGDSNGHRLTDEGQGLVWTWRISINPTLAVGVDACDEIQCVCMHVMLSDRKKERGVSEEVRVSCRICTRTLTLLHSQILDEIKTWFPWGTSTTEWNIYMKWSTWEDACLLSYCVYVSVTKTNKFDRLWEKWWPHPQRRWSVRIKLLSDDWHSCKYILFMYPLMNLSG